MNRGASLLQNVEYNSTGNPSIPGAFDRENVFIVCTISPSHISDFIRMFFSGKVVLVLLYPRIHCKAQIKK